MRSDPIIIVYVRCFVNNMAYKIKYLSDFYPKKC